MSRLEESFVHELSYRSIMDRNGRIKVFTEKDFIEVESEISFDEEGDYRSSINYFAASIAGGIMKNILFNAKKENITIMELESTVKMNLENPLSLLGVKGYDEKPEITRCNMKIYVYSDIEDQELEDFCNRSLEKSFIYNTLKKGFEFNVRFIWL